MISFYAIILLKLLTYLLTYSPGQLPSYMQRSLSPFEYGTALSGYGLLGILCPPNIVENPDPIGYKPNYRLWLHAVPRSGVSKYM